MEEPLHREILEEHARSPMFNGRLEDFNFTGNWVSKKSGNSCTVELFENNSVIINIHFDGQGSALSEACASLMCSQVKGMNQLESKVLSHNIISFIEKGKEIALPGDLIVYKTISRFPERHDCSLLPWRALLNAFQSSVI
ncbi:iron-sulfur cluster assembly scaffold protein [Opitutales bacterium]|nr:iron-sulfur cluster assembly scaffold protein [Opitutales bacterium]